jgi:hypothetical protein
MSKFEWSHKFESIVWKKQYKADWTFLMITWKHYKIIEMERRGVMDHKSYEMKEKGDKMEWLKCESNNFKLWNGNIFCNYVKLEASFIIMAS